MARRDPRDRAPQRFAALFPFVQKHWRLTLTSPALFLGGDIAVNSTAFGPSWSEIQVAQLRHWADAASEDALPRPDTSELDDALRAGHPLAVNRAASDLAIRLGKLHLLGAAAPSTRVQWHIPDTDTASGLEPALAKAVEADRLDAYFADLRPAHPDYAALRSALGLETDRAKRIALARTMERWRWMPRSLGEDYVIANAAGFEVTLWRGGARVKRWPAISGKTATPTPSLKAEIIGVNFNPWWEVPASIAKESNMRPGGRYVWNGTRFRQPPGPANALGQMKLVMPNRYNIYLHDTPSRGLFTAETRAFSHGCMRVGDAIGFAETLLEGVRTREQIDKILNPKLSTSPILAAPPAKVEPKSTVVSLGRKLPVYVTYMTVTTKDDGTLAFHKDIYGRDAKIAASLPDLPENKPLPQVQ